MKLGIIIPWFGRELKGGAEQQAWQIATRLAGRGHHVEMLTTCCRSHQEDWGTNHLPDGLSMEHEGFAVRRFPVVPRDRAAFDRVCGNLLSLDPTTLKPGVPPVSADDSRVFVNELIKAPALLEHLKENKHEYRGFILLPYLYGPVLQAIDILGRQAFLQPCLHDESYAYLPEVAEAFYRAKRLLFNSEGELELALRLYGPGIWTKSVLVGEGVEVDVVPAASNGTAPAITPSLHSSTTPQLPPPNRFLLYLGRKDAGKNVPLLLHAFARFRAVRPNSSLRLLLAGNGALDLNGGDHGAEDLGLVSEERKLQLLRDCVALVQPSQNESFSRVMMEAWLHGKPVAAHARCPATAIPVRKTGAGWLADSEEDWTRLLVELDRTSEKTLRQLGENGRRYAEVAADWDAVMERYEGALFESEPPPEQQVIDAQPDKAINQFLPNLEYGDAISNHAIWIRDELRKLGFRSEIYVRYIDVRVAHQCHVFKSDALHSSDAAIYHHSIGTELTPHLVAFRGPKCLIYHNITPAEFFLPYRPEFAAILAQGREDLHRLAAYFPISCGDSAYNALELADAGFHKPGVLPIAVNPDKWSISPDPQLMDVLHDGRTNLLFVGRFAPNKKQDDLIVAFSHYLACDPDARLILVGKPEEQDPYVAHLRRVVASLGLDDSVLFTGSITDAQLAAYYRTAHLFWSMSEHEGFCVPLIEAMWFNVPVLAFKSSAVPETLGDAALTFSDKSDLRVSAALAWLLVTDASLREKMMRAQRGRRVAFLPSGTRLFLNDIVRRFVPLQERLASRSSTLL
jgi:glycosyltransferase involved in cell wall biosynthesis